MSDGSAWACWNDGTMCEKQMSRWYESINIIYLAMKYHKPGYRVVP
jgi:hypothetical protein